MNVVAKMGRSAQVQLRTCKMTSGAGTRFRCLHMALLAFPRVIMNPDLKSFIQPIAHTIAATLFLVFTVAFVSVPYVLQQNPGDPLSPSQQTVLRHMT